jgi:hypothetical protein
MFGFLSMQINEFIYYLFIFFQFWKRGFSFPDSKLVQNGESCVLVEKVIFTCRKPPQTSY